MIAPATLPLAGLPLSHASASALPPVQYVSAQLALVPVAPLLLLPFILVVFVIFAPLWGAALLVIALLRAIFWPIERVLAALRVPGAGEASEALARANRWVSTVGGLTERYTAARRHPDDAPAADPRHREPGA